MSSLDLSVITVSHNHSRVIRNCLASLYSLPDVATFETLLIDNLGASPAAAWTHAHFPQVKLLLNPVRRGFAANVNAGMTTLLNGRYFLLLNPDVICIPGVLDRLVAFMDDHADVGIAAPQLFDPDGALQANCRRFATPRALAFRALHLDAIWRNHSVMRRYLMSGRDGTSATEVDWVTGAVAIVRRSAIAQIGLLDERYFLYWEDMDWCCRMWRAGWKVCRVPEASAIHSHRREGVRRPFSRAGYSQVAGAIQFFIKFGCKPASFAGRS
jgi:N-acetylglucosaminyl-diphospho-decaprenol L-rhamnosyltransferase